MKKSIIAIAFTSIMVLATLSNTVFAKQSKESFKENIQNAIKSITTKIKNNFFEELITLILKIIYNINLVIMGIGILFFMTYALIQYIIKDYFPVLERIIAAILVTVLFVPYMIVLSIFLILRDILYPI